MRRADARGIDFHVALAGHAEQLALNPVRDDLRLRKHGDDGFEELRRAQCRGELYRIVMAQLEILRVAFAAGVGQLRHARSQLFHPFSRHEHRR